MPAWVLGPATLLQAVLVSHPGGPGQLEPYFPGASQEAARLRAYS